MSLGILGIWEPKKVENFCTISYSSGLLGTGKCHFVAVFYVFMLSFHVLD